MMAKTTFHSRYPLHKVGKELKAESKRNSELVERYISILVHRHLS